MSTLASNVVSWREKDSECSYPSSPLIGTSTHCVELAVSCRVEGIGGKKSANSVDMGVKDGCVKNRVWVKIVDVPH